MELLLHWVSEHGFDLLEAGGIAVILVFAALAFRRDGRERQISNLHAIGTAHREIWSELYNQPELARILDPEVDVRRAPPTTKESLFVTFLFNHLNLSLKAAKAGLFTPIGALERDVQWFFSLPIPKTVWELSAAFQDRELVEFVERTLESTEFPGVSEKTA